MFFQKKQKSGKFAYLCVFCINMRLITPTLRKDYAVGKTEVVSTVGAGDNFNAGVVCGLIANGTDAACIGALPEQAWDRLIATATQFAQEVCGTTRNYISVDSGRRFRSENTR